METYGHQVKKNIEIKKLISTVVKEWKRKIDVWEKVGDTSMKR